MAIFNVFVWGLLFIVFIIKLVGSIRIVPTQSAFIVERLGKYKNTLEPGFHLLVPFVEKVAFRQLSFDGHGSVKEIAGVQM